MGKKSWLKNLIFENGEPKENTEQSSTETSKHVPKQESSKGSIKGVRSQQMANVEIAGKIDQVLLNKLCKVLDEQPAEGIDYVKFKKSVDSLKDFQPDENIRFTTAFVTLRATNNTLSKEYLIQTIDKYIELMEQERIVGMEQLKTLKSKEIDKKSKEIEDAAKDVEKMKAEITRLTRFISEGEQELNTKKSEIIIREADFNITVDKIVNQLKNDKIKIETIIK